MGSFSYKAYDSEGGEVHGKIDAQTLDNARALLQGQKLMVASVSEDNGYGINAGFFSNTRVSAQELEYLTSELSLLLNSGVTIDRGLAVMRRSATSQAQGKLIAGLHDAVRRGESLAGAMSMETELFNPLYINLVKIGEASGTLPIIFERLAEDIKFQSELKRKIFQALTYPAAVFAVCVLCIVFIFNYIVPEMSGLFAGMPAIPTYTAVLLGISEWMLDYQWFLFFGIISSAAALIAFIKTPAGAVRVDDTLMRIPGLSHVFILIERTRFNTAIAMMLGSGILIDRCVDMAVGNIKNQTLRQGLVIAKNRVKKGETLANALATSPLYPDFSVSLIEVGEESGNLEPVFNELSHRARREFEGWVDRFISLLEPLLILFMGGIVGSVVVTMLLSIVSVNDIGF